MTPLFSRAFNIGLSFKVLIYDYARDTHIPTALQRKTDGTLYWLDIMADAREGNPAAGREYRLTSPMDIPCFLFNIFGKTIRYIDACLLCTPFTRKILVLGSGGWREIASCIYILYTRTLSSPPFSPPLLLFSYILVSLIYTGESDGNPWALKCLAFKKIKCNTHTHTHTQGKSFNNSQGANEELKVKSRAAVEVARFDQT